MGGKASICNDFKGFVSIHLLFRFPCSCSRYYHQCRCRLGRLYHCSFYLYILVFSFKLFAFFLYLLPVVVLVLVSTLALTLIVGHGTECTSQQDHMLENISRQEEGH